MFSLVFLSIIFGAVQGLTEFLPISSSGHLLILHEFFDVQLDELSFDAALHLGTLFALLIYFASDIRKLIIAFFGLFSSASREDEHGRLIVPIILGTIPAAIVGFFLEDIIAEMLRSPWIVVATLIVGGLLFILVERLKASQELIAIKNRQGFFIGIAQALALIPGISRSGITITAGMASGFSRYASTRFSFLLSIPIVLGAGIKKLIDLLEENLATSDYVAIAAGIVAACVFGIFAIRILLKFTQSHRLHAFAYYRFVLAVLLAVSLVL